MYYNDVSRANQELAEPSKKLSEDTSSPEESEKDVENSTNKNG